MTETSPLREAQQRFADAIPWRRMAAETCSLEQALGRTLHQDVVAQMDSPPYPRAIVEGYLVASKATAGASEEQPLSFEITGSVAPGDSECPTPAPGCAIEVATGSIVPAGPYAIVRMWEAEREGEHFRITRPFPPGFFIEEQGCDVKQGSVVMRAGQTLDPAAIGTLASLGIAEVSVSAKPRVTIFASGDEVIPYTEPPRPGAIFDCDSVMLAAAVTQAGGIPHQGGIQGDDFDTFVATARQALEQADMLVIAGGTAVAGRDFISDLVRELGDLIVDGVPMRSGRPLIMGVAGGKPIVCVAGHPPEALRGFLLFGTAAIDRLLGRETTLPEDPNAPAN